jgi:hypothetical protein
MTTQHTPGPWEIEHCRNEDGSPFLSISGQGSFGAWLADIQPGSVNGKPMDVGPRHEANARLIAASPDLLAALEWSMRCMGDYLSADSQEGRDHCYKDLAHAHREAIKAIAKAKGAA